MNFPSFSLAGKNAVLVGAGRGIGYTLALGLAQAGADVVVASRTITELEDLAGRIRHMGRRCLPHPVDVQKLNSIEALQKAAETELGPVDILVNNAGGNVNQSALEVTEESWDLILNTNLKGLFFCSQTFGRQMLNRGRGKIINISSTFGLVGFKNRASYASSKGGVTQLTKVLAIEWSKSGVCVNAIAPTAVHTPMNEKLFSDPEWRKDVLSRIPIGRFCEPVDLVGPMVFLASSASDMVTGITLPVDGGWTAW
ncbi:MAG: SDR family oxidoreductase [Deltaproteobacteria bacterium]|nr:SDR family oxidoreductase [Deltaproteobacteria bacterium]